MSRTHWLSWFSLVLLSLALGGTTPSCATSCDDGEEGPAERVTSGTTNADGTFYESDSWDGDYLEFLPTKRYDFVHGLRRAPDLFQVFVGFIERPLGNEGNGNISEAVGNEAIIEAVNDEFVRVRNDTCETFYVRFVAGVIDDEGTGAAGEQGAGGSGAGAAGE